MKKKSVTILRSAAAFFTLAALAVIVAVTLTVNRKAGVLSEMEFPFLRDTEAMAEENYSPGDVCTVTFRSMTGDYVMKVDFTYDQWQRLPAEVGRDGNVYLLDNGGYLAFDHDVTESEINAAVLAERSGKYGWTYALALIPAAAAAVLLAAAYGAKRNNKN